DAARHDLYGRADDQSRPPARKSAVGRLDGGDAGSFAVGPVRAYDRGNGYRLRDFHAVAERPRPARPAGLMSPPGKYWPDRAYPGGKWAMTAMTSAVFSASN